MLRIRKEQLAHYRQKRLGEFGQAMALYLTSWFSSWMPGWDEARIRAFVSDGLEEAERLQIDVEPEASQWLVLRLLLAHHQLLDASWVKTALSPKLNGEGKVRSLIVAMREHQVPDLPQALVIEELIPRGS